MPLSPPRRIVLLGFMASGKTAVGRALAERIGWTHLDLDEEIEKKVGATVQEIFAERGEAGFRALEVSLTPELLADERTILSPGGGWITNPGLFDRLSADTLTVWLRVSPREVARRLASDPHQPVRPLLSGPESSGRIEALMATREPLYGAASITVETDGRAVSEIVAEIESVVRPGLEK